jgi:hypothetical protein
VLFRPENFSALTRLDHNRAIGQLAIKAGVPVEQVRFFLKLMSSWFPSMF